MVPEPYLAELTRQMLLGLSFLHDTARICHRDVKPSNLLLSSSGQLKISDFGTSSQLSNSMSKCLSWVGTVTYMSPERIRGDSYSFNTDVWSLGLLVLECALGRYPYPPQQQGAAEAGAGAAAAAPPPKLGFWELLEYIGEHVVLLSVFHQATGSTAQVLPSQTYCNRKQPQLPDIQSSRIDMPRWPR